MHIRVLRTVDLAAARHVWFDRVQRPRCARSSSTV